MGPDEQVGVDVLAARTVLTAELLDEPFGILAGAAGGGPARREVTRGSLGVPERTRWVLTPLLGVLLLGEHRVLGLVVVVVMFG